MTPDTLIGWGVGLTCIGVGLLLIGAGIALIREVLRGRFS